RHALLEVAVGGHDVDVVVEGALAGGGVGVEQTPLTAGRHREADRAREALAERTGRDLDAVGVPVLGVAGRLGAPRAQGLDVLELEAEPAEVELDVLREARVPRGEDEAVPAEPGSLRRVQAPDLR